MTVEKCSLTNNHVVVSSNKPCRPFVHHTGARRRQEYLLLTHVAARDDTRTNFMIPKSITTVLYSVLTQKKSEHETTENTPEQTIDDITQVIEWLNEHADQDHVYIGKVLEKGETHITTTKIGVSKPATKQACIETCRKHDLVPPRTLHRLEWEEDTAEVGNWDFIIKEKELHKETTEQSNQH